MVTPKIRQLVFHLGLVQIYLLNLWQGKGTQISLVLLMGGMGVMEQMKYIIFINHQEGSGFLRQQFVRKLN